MARQHSGKPYADAPFYNISSDAGFHSDDANFVMATFRALAASLPFF